ncbi:MAG: site-specific integrase [Nitrospirales bacterium]
MPKLTKRLIDSVPQPASGQAFYRDTELQGFALRVTPGSKSFTYERRINGRSRRMTIGPYPGMTVEEARTEAAKKVGAIAQGHDPASERQARYQEPTFKDLEQLYLAEHAIRKKSKDNDVSILTHHLATWRRRRLSTITHGEVASLHVRLGTTPSSIIRPGRTMQKPIPTWANRTITLLHTMFELAIARGLHPGPNPAQRIKKFSEVKRDRFITPDELPHLLAALQQEPNPYVRGAFFVSLLTGARRNEVLSMRWADLDMGQAVWRIPETKADRPHRIPMPAAVLEELRRLPRLEGNPFVFCGRWGQHHLVNVSKPWARIRKEAGLLDVRIHDLRRTLGSWLAAAGSSLPLIGKALNHSQASTTQIYARLNLDPVRAALEANATRMLEHAPAVKKEGMHGS